MKDASPINRRPFMRLTKLNISVFKENTTMTFMWNSHLDIAGYALSKLREFKNYLSQFGTDGILRSEKIYIVVVNMEVGADSLS